LAGRRLAARGVTGEQAGEPGQGQHGVADQAVTHRGAAGLGRIVGDVQQPQAGRQVRAGHVRVVPEHRRAHDQGHVVPGQLVGQRAHRERQSAYVQRVVFGERGPLGRRGGPDRGVQRLGERDRFGPSVSPRDGRAVDQHGVGCVCDDVGELAQPGRVGRDSGGERPDHGGPGAGLVPVIQRQG
jgi:hypothetical protein